VLQRVLQRGSFGAGRTPQSPTISCPIRRDFACGDGRRRYGTAVVVHLRIVSPAALSDRVLALLMHAPVVANVVHLAGAAKQPAGDVILCDVAGEEASVIVSDLRELGVLDAGSVAIEHVDTELSTHGRAAEAYARGSSADAVLWEQVAARTSEDASLSPSFLIFMVLAAIIAAVGVYEDSAVLIVGAMVVCPDFGPVASLCVGLVERRRRLVGWSLLTVVVGFALAIGVAAATAAVLQGVDMVPHAFDRDSGLAKAIASPDSLAFVIALCAGVAGMLSLTTAKSGALIGVLISVTTIPAAAASGLFMVEGAWPEAGGAARQLGVNIAGLVLAGSLTVYFQRLLYLRGPGPDGRRAAPRAVGPGRGPRAALDSRGPARRRARPSCPARTRRRSSCARARRRRS
jgi:uncharacterized hydrophobic protein (TIGR00271 family)